MDPMNKEMLRLALPSILANLTVPLVGMVDIAIAGHLNTSAAALIGGISVGSLMFDLLYWNFGFLRAGTGGMTAQAFGRQDWKDCAGNLTRGVSLAFLISIILISLQWPFQKLIFLFVGCSEEVRTLALEYFYIRIWAAPATLCLMAFRGWFIGMQDTFSSMLADVIVNGGNILFSLLLAFGIPGTGFNGLGFKGIAWGTVAAQYSGLLFALGRVGS
jgi:multidrug resistance protein, MATE family